MFSRIHILFLFIFYPSEIIGASVGRSIRNSAFDNNKVLFNKFIQTKEPSLTSCTINCAAKPTCISLNFNQLSGTCVLFELDFTDLGSTATQFENGWLYLYFGRDFAKDLPSRCVATIPTGICSLFCLHYIYNAIAVYTDFASMCSQLDGGEMIKIDRELKQHCVENILADKPDAEGDVYIQGTREGYSDTWRYDDGTMVTYFNWRPGQPNEITAPYIALRKVKSFLWQDVVGIHQQAVICQQN